MSTQRTHDVPGDPVSTETDVLAKGAAMLQVSTMYDVF